MASNIIFAAQTALLSKLPQGNDSMQSAVMSAIIIATVGVATSYGQTIVSSAIAIIHKYYQDNWCLRHPKTHSVYVPQYIKSLYKDPDTNRLYESFSWYLSRKLLCVTGALRAVNATYAKYTVPEDNHEASITHNDFKITYIYETSEKRIDDKTTQKQHGIRFRVGGENAQPILDLLSHAMKTLDEAQSAAKWIQKICYPIRTSDGLRWSAPRQTHNMKTWDTVVLDQTLKDRLVKDIDVFMNSEQWYQTMGVSWARGLLLYGLPGCGKTSIIKALSHVHKLDLYYLALNEVESDKELRQLFEAIPTRSVLVLEDVDAMGKDIVGKRSTSDDKPDSDSDSDAASDSSTKKRKKVVTKTYKKWSPPKRVTLSSFLNLLDGVGGVHGRIMIMTTNHPEKLDPALLRPGRCDLKIHVRICDEQGLKDLYKMYFDKDIDERDLELISKYSLTPADVTSVFLTNRLTPEVAMQILCEIGESKKNGQIEKKEEFELCP